MKVAVLGLGVIGKRLADAVSAHPSLDLVGVGVRGANGAVLARPGLAYFGTEPSTAAALAAAGVTVRGPWSDALRRADLVIDAGPSRSGAGRAPSYAAAGVAVRFCGGERDRGLGPVLHSALNRSAGVGTRTARLASCNTTAIGRVLAALGVAEIAGAHATVVKCATDTDKAGKGITNGAVFDARPSHHASDLAEIVPDLPLTSQALSVPMVSGHLILLRVRMRPGAAASAVERLGDASGITLLDAGRAHDSATIRFAALTGSVRGDRHDVAVQVHADGDMLSLALSLDNEAVTIPEAVDAVLAFGEGSHP